jgi:hypothetical protein
MAFPYGFYPSVFPPAHTWYPQPAPPNLNPAIPAGIHPPPPILPKTDVPKIRAWLDYCDRHPERQGEDFGAHGDRFDEEGYRRISQLTGERISVEKLSKWLGIGKGTADLLIQYAEEDMELVKAGTFSMELVKAGMFSMDSELADGLNSTSSWN